MKRYPVLVILLALFLISSGASADCTQILKLQPDNPPTKLSDTGIFENLDQLKPCASVLEYDINLPFWSDGASKRRFIILPAGGKIQFSANDPWIFPKGTIFVKHFELPIANSKKIRVETRLFMNLDDGDWYGYSYQWQDDQKDALLLDDSATKDYIVYDPASPGSAKKQSWWFPSPNACLQCHNSWSGYSLGVRTEQINTGSQLDSWNEKNFFTTKIEKAVQYPAYVTPTSEQYPIEKRVKSYLASNCAQCHQPGSPVRTSIDFRFKTPLAEMQIISVKANAGDANIPNALIVSPGKKETSVLWQRLKTTSTLRMPPIGSNEVDNSAVDLIGKWIDGLKP
jgi:uncharacterized repeat protein (TIGR03806 family)